MDMGCGIKAAASQTYRRIARGASVVQRHSQSNGNAGNACILNLLGKARNTSYLIDLILCPRTTLYAATSSVWGVEMRGPRNAKSEIGLVRTRIIGRRNA